MEVCDRKHVVIHCGCLDDSGGSSQHGRHACIASLIPTQCAASQRLATTAPLKSAFPVRSDARADPRPAAQRHFPRPAVPPFRGRPRNAVRRQQERVRVSQRATQGFNTFHPSASRRPPAAVIPVSAVHAGLVWSALLVGPCEEDRGWGCR